MSHFLSASAQREPAPDEEAFDQFYREHGPTILAYLRLHTASREEAEDLLLEVFLAALQQPQLLDEPEEKQLAWLRTVAHHKLVDAYRRQGRRPNVRLDLVTELLYEDEAISPEQVALQREKYAHVAALLNQLSESQRQTVLLHFIYGLSCAEIASVQGKREGAVRKALTRALKFTRTRFTEQEGNQHV